MMVFKLINFAILVVALVWLIRKFDLFKFLEIRKEKVKKQINETQNLKIEAKDLKKERERELEKAREMQQSMIKDAKKIGQKTRQNLLKEAEEEAERILEEAQVIAEMEKNQARKQLRQETIALIISAAYDILEKEVKYQDHQSLTDSFLDELEESRDTVGVF